MSRTVSVTAPSRLHFGMLAFGRCEARQFGGAGVMIGRPLLKLHIHPAEELDAAGPLADRAIEFVRRIACKLGLPDVPRCRIDIESAPRQHVGMGVGTQLGLSLAAGLNRFLGRPDLSMIELARLVGRGRRSAIGTHGFSHGGLIVESGKLAADVIAPLICRTEIPEAWRFVLVCPRDQEGLSGTGEQRAFAELPPVPQAVTDELCSELTMHLIPAAIEGRFSEFSESLYRYGHLAGTCFAARQGGPYASARSAQLVAAIRRYGIPGVGQSSWGPTIFALTPHESEARALAKHLQDQPDSNDLELTIAAPANQGARVE